MSARVLDTPNLEVLMTFVGTEEIWVFRLTVAEFEAAQFNLEEIFSEAEMLGMTQEEVDELQGEVCAPAGARTKTGERIVTALVDAMGDKVWDMRKTACEE
ncbi:MAG: hypothetical protein M5R36_23325 [Deltaproteobacteria bacterium]|nr:hypothetical protein [Deltaproteobacteria bacterium]